MHYLNVKLIPYKCNEGYYKLEAGLAEHSSDYKKADRPSDNQESHFEML